jgi:malate dehydrogenase (oxaloacetate-decarboxylating)
MLGAIASAIGAAGGDIAGIDIVHVRGDAMIRDFTVGVRDEAHADAIVLDVKKLKGVRVRNVSDPVLLAHLGGKIEVRSKMEISTPRPLFGLYPWGGSGLPGDR